jgi:hypothetical protein
MGKKQTFLSDYENTPSGPMRHLNVIITEADENLYYLVVPITTYRRNKDGKPFGGQDGSCILSAGCHPFIKRESYVFYAKARKMSYAEIFNGIKKGILIRKEDMPVQYLLDMQKGASISPANCFIFSIIFNADGVNLNRRASPPEVTLQPRGAACP